MKRRRLQFSGLGALPLGMVCLLTATVPAVAHHSAAMFDMSTSITLVGTVVEFQWTNPHCWIELMGRSVSTDVDVRWSVEGTSPNAMTRVGWKHGSLKAGDRLTVTLHPMKDGSHVGSLVSAVLPGGAKLPLAPN